MEDKQKALEILIEKQIFDDFVQKFELIHKELKKKYFKYCTKGKIDEARYCFIEVERNFLCKATLSLKYKKIFVDKFIESKCLVGSDEDINYFEIYQRIIIKISEKFELSFTESMLYLINYFDMLNIFKENNRFKVNRLFCNICKKYFCLLHHKKVPKNISHVLVPSDYNPLDLQNNYKSIYLHNYQKGPNSHLWLSSHTKLIDPLASLIPNLNPKKLPLPDSFNTFLQLLQVNNSSPNCSCKVCSSDCPCLQGVINTTDQKSFPFRGHCEIYCNCPLTCPSKFLGCDCAGPCNTSSCICFLNKIECDPWLCRRCCSLQEVKFSVSLCQNVRIQRKLGIKKVKLGKSEIQGAGIGVFADENIESGEFIGEYCGELISEREANRRGAFYDLNQHSYLFMIDSVVTIDATFCGSMLRYINHKKNDFANAETANWRVLGVTKVMVLAKERIEKGAEIFFDYKYPETVEYQWYREYNQQFEREKGNSKKDEVISK